MFVFISYTIIGVSKMVVIQDQDVIIVKKQKVIRQVQFAYRPKNISDFARYVGVSRQNVYLWLSGKTAPSKEHMKKIRQYFKEHTARKEAKWEKAFNKANKKVRRIAAHGIDPESEQVLTPEEIDPNDIVY